MSGKCFQSKHCLPTFLKQKEQSFTWSLKFYSGNPKLPYSDKYLKLNIVGEDFHIMNIFLTNVRL